MNYGYVDGVIQKVKDSLGTKKQLPFIYYKENGSWREDLPKYENQTTKTDEETWGCTVWGWENAFEIFEQGVYRVEPNYSERFTYNLVPVIPGKGAHPTATLGTILDRGLVSEQDMPMTRTLSEFTDKSDLTGSLLAKGQNWLVKNELLAEELWDNSNPFKQRPANYIEVLKENLKRAPVPVSVSAWREVDGVYVSDKGGVNNHFCVCFEVIDFNGYKDCPVIFDSYDHSIKVLHPDHNIRRAYAFWINKRTRPAMRRHVSILQAIINRLMQRQTLLSVATAALGADVTPQDATPDEVACSEVVTTLLRKVYPETPLITGTWTLNNFLANSPQWKEVNEYEPECVVVAPTGTGRQGTIGHTWIVMDDGTLASNNSYGLYKGKFTKNYTPATAERKYRDDYKMQMHIYKHV